MEIEQRQGYVGQTTQIGRPKKYTIQMLVCALCIHIRRTAALSRKKAPEWLGIGWLMIISMCYINTWSGSERMILQYHVSDHVRKSQLLLCRQLVRCVLCFCCGVGHVSRCHILHNSSQSVQLKFSWSSITGCSFSLLHTFYDRGMRSRADIDTCDSRFICSRRVKDVRLCEGCEWCHGLYKSHKLLF